jgi:uncharacterized protein (DUF2252 family)
VQGQKVSTFDTETLFRSIGADGKGVASAATDVGRFHESVAIQGRELGLSDVEIDVLQHSFLDAYKAAAPGAANKDFDAATTFYEANYDLIHIRSAAFKARKEGTEIDRTAIERLLSKAKVTTR